MRADGRGEKTNTDNIELEEDDLNVIYHYMHGNYTTIQSTSIDLQSQQCLHLITIINSNLQHVKKDGDNYYN